MPLEFRCPDCSRWLRAPERVAGLRTRCPNCWAVVVIRADESPTLAERPFSQTPANLYADAPGDGLGSGTKSLAAPLRTGEALNPYLSPRTEAREPKSEVLPILVHRVVTIDQLFQRTWWILRDRFFPVAAVSLIAMGVSSGASMLFLVINLLVQATRQAYLVILSSAMQQIVNLLVGAFLQAGMTMVLLRMVREQRVEFNLLFAGIRPMWRVALFNLLITLLVLVVALPFAAPAVGFAVVEQYDRALLAGGIGVALATPLWIALAMSFLVAGVFIIDRDCGVIESLRLSYRFMKGNRITAVLAMIVIHALFLVFVLATCLLGSLVLYGASTLFIVVVYLSVTGSPVKLVHPQAKQSPTPVVPVIGMGRGR